MKRFYVIFKNIFILFIYYSNIYTGRQQNHVHDHAHKTKKQNQEQILGMEKSGWVAQYRKKARVFALFGERYPRYNKARRFQTGLRLVSKAFSAKAQERKENNEKKYSRHGYGSAYALVSGNRLRRKQ